MAIKDDILYIGSDSCITNGWEKNKTGSMKSGNAGGYIALFAGTVPAIQSLYNFSAPDSTLQSKDYVFRVYIPALRNYLKEIGYWNAEKAKIIYDWEFLVFIRGKMYNIDSFLTVHEEEEFATIGNGGTTAKAVMDVMWESGMPMKDLIELSLETAAKYNIGVEAPFHIEEIKLTNDKSKKKKR